jgi:hypothetical protein
MKHIPAILEKGNLFFALMLPGYRCRLGGYRVCAVPLTANAV